MQPTKVCSWSRVARYQGERKPACHGGAGCVRCRAKWRRAQKIKKDVAKWHADLDAGRVTYGGYW